MRMNLTSPSQIKAWCIENGFHPNRTLGQNFLIDLNTLRGIVDAGFAGMNPEGLKVLEIGPGLGVMTEEMLARGAQVTAVEKDPILAARLAEALENPPGLAVYAADALDYLARGPEQTAVGIADVRQTGTFDCLVSNLPYQAGTRILLDLVSLRTIPVLTALVQTEVAERLAAKEGTKTRGLAGVWAQLDYDVQIVRRVSAGCFWPRPEVGSSVVRLTRHDRNVSLSAEERHLFRNITKTAFAHRRKQLGTVFKDMIQSTARAEELSNENWIDLVKGLLHENT